jgi:flagellar assembly protein FliH
MLSKILRGAKLPDVTRLRWPAAPGSAPAPGNSEGAPSGDAAARRLAELEEQAERRVREARQAGHAEGQAAGRAQAAAELQPVLEKVARAVTEIAGLRPRLMREAQGELVELSLRIARRILHRELSVDPGALDGLVAGALEKLAAQEICRVRIHPELEAGVRQALAREGRGGLVVIADGSLPRGALLVETARGKLDASLETQLAEIGRGLADRIPER